MLGGCLKKVLARHNILAYCQIWNCGCQFSFHQRLQTGGWQREPATVAPWLKIHFGTFCEDRTWGRSSLCAPQVTQPFLLTFHSLQLSHKSCMTFRLQQNRPRLSAYTNIEPKPRLRPFPLLSHSKSCMFVNQLASSQPSSSTSRISRICLVFFITSSVIEAAQSCPA